jgi:hypothetical protein
MRPLRTLGLALLGLVGLAFVAFGADDITRDAPPPMQERYFERIGGVSPEVRALSLAAFDGQGGLFLASGSALLFLTAIPIRRGERWALAAAALIVLCGNAGIILSTTQIGAGHLPMDVLLGMGLAGCGLCWASTRTT